MQTLKQLAIAGFIFTCVFLIGFGVSDGQWQAKHNDYITDRDKADAKAAAAEAAAQKAIDDRLAGEMEESERQKTMSNLKKPRATLAIQAWGLLMTH